MTEEEVFAWAVAEMLVGRLRGGGFGTRTSWLEWSPPQPLVVGNYEVARVVIWSDDELAAAAQGRHQHTLFDTSGPRRVVEALLRGGV